MHATATPPTPPGDMLQMLMEDIKAVLKNDPAARNYVEIALSYPGLHAIWLHRITHSLWLQGARTLARVLSNVNRSLTGVEIHPAAQLGRRVFIDHGMGVVIGETAVVGDDCLIYKGVLLGGTSLDRNKRHPTLGRGVVVGSNACILGSVTIGDRAKIGSGSVVIRDVPSGSTAVGVPGRIVATTDIRYPLDHASLPDPISTVLRSMADQIEALSRKVEQLEAREGDTNHESPRRDPRAQLAAVFFEDFGE